jgi:hypothetical protein
MAKDLTDNFVANTYKGLLHAQGDEIPAVGEVDIYDGAGNKTDLTLGRETTICTSLSAGVLSAAGLEYPTELGSKYDVVAQVTDGENDVGRLALQDISSLLCAGTTGLSSYEPPTDLTKVPIPTIECGIVTGITEKNICDINEAIGGITSEYDPASYIENNFITDLDVECGVVKKIHYGSISLPQFFTLSSNKSTAIRGKDTFTIRLRTQNVSNGSLVPYTITGVESNDIDGAPLAGRFTVQDGTGTITFTATNPSDETETFTLTLDNGFDAVSVDLGTGFTLSNNRFCISIINDTEGQGATPQRLRTAYNTFRDTYPNRLLTVILYESTYRNNREIYIPPRMVNDPNTIIRGNNNITGGGYYRGNRPLLGKNAASQTDWFEFARLNTLSLGDKVYYYIDPSGSLPGRKIKADLEKFKQRCKDNGVSFNPLKSAGIQEDYISPFIKDLP